MLVLVKNYSNKEAAIAQMIEDGESRETIINFFQRSDSVMTGIIRRKLDGELESKVNSLNFFS